MFMNNSKTAVYKNTIIVFLILSCAIMAQTENNLESIDIKKAIELELISDDYFSSELIDVEVNEGIVTLSGTVDNLLAKERSERITESIKGVRSVINRIQVNPEMMVNSQLEDKIDLALVMDPLVSSYTLDMVVNDGVVTLNGKVGSWTEKQLAARVIKGIRGVKELLNNVQIVYDDTYTDDQIKDAVERKFELDPYVSETLIDVSVNKGEVKLSGNVGSLAEKRFAFGDAWVTGVNSVDDSKIVVNEWAKDEMKRNYKVIIKTDQNIKDAIVDALIYDPRVASFDIDVKVENGFVTLSGEVNNLKAKTSAFADAINAAGVLGVENKIKVRPVGDFTDEELEKKISEVFNLDPIVEIQNIDVIVRNQEAYLYGMTNSYGKKFHASDIVASVMGVVDVTNYITVENMWSYKTDRIIKEDIENELFWSLMVDEENINVTVDDGIATLTGEVESTTQLNTAVNNAFEGGAKSVVSKLDVEEQPFYEFRDYYIGFPLFLY